MGVNITAIIPIEKPEFKIKKLIKLIEENEIKELDNFYNAILEERFPTSSFDSPQWFYKYEKIGSKPKVVNINTPLEIPQQLVFRFTNNAVEIWSYIRAFLFIKHNPKSQKALIKVYKKICTLLNAKECWIMGDCHQICHTFRKGQCFNEISKKEIAKKSLNGIYVELDNEGTYDIIGYYKMKI